MTDDQSGTTQQKPWPPDIEDLVAEYETLLVKYNGWPPPEWYDSRARLQGYLGQDRVDMFRKAIEDADKRLGFDGPPPPISEAVERYERLLVAHRGQLPPDVVSEIRQEQIRIGRLDRFLTFAKHAARVQKRIGYESTWPDGFYYEFPTDAELEAPDEDDEGTEDDTSTEETNPNDWRVW